MCQDHPGGSLNTQSPVLPLLTNRRHLQGGDDVRVSSSAPPGDPGAQQGSNSPDLMSLSAFFLCTNGRAGGGGQE